MQREKAEATSRLKAMAAEWQSRLDAATEAAVKESQRLEASHAVFVARLQEDVDQLRKQRGAAAEGQGKEAAALAERLSGLEREKTKVTGERDELEGRLSQMEKNHREALRLFEERTAAARGENALEATSLKATIVEWQSRFDAATKAATQESHRLETRQGTEVKRLQEALTQVREKAEAAARDHAREAATLAERLSVFERDTARVSGERAGVEARLSQAEESHREAMRLAEARLAEADARLRSAEARLAATAESWKAASEGAGQASESLRAALEARALESGAHFKAVDAWEAHRAALEQRIAELESAGVESSALQPRSQRPGAASSREAEEGGPPEFDESREDGGMGFLPNDLANDGSGVNPDATGKQARPSFVRWEYERVFQAAPEVEKSAVQSWVQDVARRIRRR